ncbi:MAG: two-component system, OmpR family, osmolarity sensor histidine kinase EnvZ [Aliidongia sp.]|jgi:two-component system osmolarity sensor histidine kinase EnvZ|nr:two-component system, OmpR family, osmolarity sensor histidine kinase EnvZ [Aliidongia sp.]
MIKWVLPRTLFGRSILILMTPLILVQAVTIKVFNDRLWDTVVRRLSGGVAGEIALTLEAREHEADDPAELPFLVKAGLATDLRFILLPGTKLPDPASPPGSMEEEVLTAALAERVRLPFAIDDTENPDWPRALIVSIQLPDGVMRVLVPRNRLFTGNAYTVLFWMTGTGLLTFAFGGILLRNQARSLHRLAVAAEAFGKGRDVPDFKPQGATEVRQAAAAFLVMRARLQRQITQRTEMLAGVSHDLRTPLTRMKLELELLGDGEDIQALKSDVVEMQQMIEGYLSFARGEGNEAPQVTDLVALLEDAVATSRRDGAPISLIVPSELHVAVRRDAFRRCIINLIGNAARYGGHVWVTVLPQRGAVDIMVDDDGPGIPEALRDSVFRPFFRLETSRNRSTGGVGLGLTIARDIMLSHGGDIILEVSPQGGLRARLHLPR